MFHFSYFISFTTGSSLNVITVYFWILQCFFFFFSHLSLSTTLQFVLHNSVGWGCVCVFVFFFLGDFFVQCVRMRKNIRVKSHSQVQFLGKWRWKTTRTLISFISVCIYTQVWRFNKTNWCSKFLIICFNSFAFILDSLSCLAATKISSTLLFLLLMQPLFFVSSVFVLIFCLSILGVFFNFRIGVRNWFFFPNIWFVFVCPF